MFVLIFENIMSQDSIIDSYVKIDKKRVIGHKLFLNQMKDSIITIFILFIN